MKLSKYVLLSIITAILFLFGEVVGQKIPTDTILLHGPYRFSVGNPDDPSLVKVPVMTADKRVNLFNAAHLLLQIDIAVSVHLSSGGLSTADILYNDIRSLLLINDGRYASLNIVNNTEGKFSPTPLISVQFVTADTLDLTGISSPAHVDFGKIGRLGFNGKSETGYISLLKTSVENADLYFSGQSDTCKFKSVTIGGLVRIHTDYGTGKTGGLLTLILNDVDFSSIDVDVVQTNILVDKDQSYASQYKIFKQVLRHCEDMGFTEAYEKYDKQLKELTYVNNHEKYLNLLDRYWWDYGYSKGRVLIISLNLYLLFTILNFACYRHLTAVYWPDKFRDYDLRITEKFRQTGRLKIGYHLNKAFGIALYTGYIFWGLKIEINDINLNKGVTVVLLILLQYLSGLICLGYIANFIIAN